MLYYAERDAKQEIHSRIQKIVVETQQEEKMSYSEVERRFGVIRSRITAWERIYLTEGSEGLAVERRGGKS